MAAAIVGTWRGAEGSVTGLKEYLDKVCTPDEAVKFLAYNKGYTITITKIGENQYKVVPEALWINIPMTETIVIGGKSSQGFGGFGMVEVDTWMEGDKIIGAGNVDGVQLKYVIYVDGDWLVGEKSANGITMSGRSRRV